MATGKKYDVLLTQKDEQWVAQITRQITSKKTKITKEQDGFDTEDAARAWADEQLKVFASTLNKSNQRHAEQRKANEETRRQRSNRRADKTATAKSEADSKSLKSLKSEQNLDDSE